MLRLRAIAAGLVLALVAGCADPDPVAERAVLSDRARAALRALSPLGAPPADPTNAWADDAAAADLGETLFFSPVLSRDGEVSCATCHRPDHGFADPVALSDTYGPAARHTPSLLNAGWQRWARWDGGCDSLWCQAIQPIENPVEMVSTRVSLVRTLASDPALSAAYAPVFGSLPDVSDPERFPERARPVPADPADPDGRAWRGMDAADQDVINGVVANFGKALAAFERTLVTPPGDLDRYAQAVAAGDPYGDDVLDDSAVRGLEIFLGRGQCVGCHSGPALTNGAFHNIGLGLVPGLDPADPGRYRGVDLARIDVFNGVGVYSDDVDAGARKLDYLVLSPEQEGQFKTPGLRGVGGTAPYFRGGQAATLEAVVRHYQLQDQVPTMGHTEELLFQIDLDEQDVTDLVRLLELL